MQDNTSVKDAFLLTRSQIRAGRVLAGLGVRDLAITAGLSPTAVSQIETGRTEKAHEATLRALRSALEEHGIEFKPGGWLRRRDDEHQRRFRSSEAALPRIIARNCKAARKALAMSKDEVAEAAGETVEVYTRIERGSANLSVHTILKLAHALQVSTDYLLSSVSRSELNSATSAHPRKYWSESS